MSDIKKFAFLLATALCLVACAHNSENGNEKRNTRTFTAFNETVSRTTLGTNGEILWNSTDSINIFTAEGKRCVFRDVKVSQDGKSATFSGEIPISDSYLAQYPADSDAYCESGSIFARVPSDQAAASSGFDPKANISVSVTSSDELHFMNIGAIAGFVINNDNISSVTLNATEAGGGCLTGLCRIEMDAGIPSVSSVGGEDYVSLSGSFTKGKTYYACVLPGSYTDLTVTFEDKDGRTATYSNPTGLNLTRNHMTVVCDVTVPESDWKKAPGTDWTIVTSESGLIAGNECLIVCNDIGNADHDCVVATGLNNNVLQTADATEYLNQDKSSFTTTPDKALQLTLNGTADNWTLSNKDGEKLGATKVKVLGWDSGTTTWKITFKNSNALISSTTSSYGTLKYNPGSPRFTTYGSSFDGEPVQLYSRMNASSVTTSMSASDISREGAMLQASYICIHSVPSEAGFVYGLSESALTATVYSSTPTKTGDTFSATLTGLSSATTYYYKAFVKEGNKYLYGKAGSFTTLTGGSGETGLADYCWPELPAQTDKDRNGIDDNNPDYYYSHTMRADASKIRNFSSCYSKSKLHPVWVAAPMHSCYKGGSGRNDSYQNDPNIKCTQSANFDGYTRGHMVGSSDRTISKATNRQAFYYSNIGAQLGQPGFNTGGGAWNNLEAKVDSYLCADTLYQVIGCIFKTFTDKYGTTVNEKTGKGSAGTFQVPTAWYKVLLRTKGGKTGKSVSSCTSGELQCVAFILGHYHNKSHVPNTKDMYTVAELEKLTGLTFFVNVPNAPKTSFNASDWGF